MRKLLFALFGVSLAVPLCGFGETVKYTYAAYVPKTWTTIEAPEHFTVSADTIKVVNEETQTGGQSIGVHPGYAYNAKLEDGILSYQIQISAAGIKCVKIQFRAYGNQLQVRAVLAAWANVSLGADFDRGSELSGYWVGGVATSASTYDYGLSQLAYTVESADYGMFINGSPANYSLPTPAYGQITPSLGDALSFSIPETVITNVGEHIAWTPTGHTLAFANGTAVTNSILATNFTFAAEHNSSTMTWNFVSSPLPTEVWGKKVGGKDYVYLTKGDTSTSSGNNSCVKGDNWSDGVAPNANSDYLVDLGPDEQLIARGNLTFAGRSLLLGNPDTGVQGRLLLSQTLPFIASPVDVANGLIHSVPDSGNFNRYQSQKTTILPGGSLTFALAPGVLQWYAHMNGGEDTQIVIRSAPGTYQSATAASLEEQYFSGESKAYSLTNFYGQLVIEGTNVVYRPHHAADTSTFQSPALGVSTSFRSDAVVLRHGGKLSLSSSKKFSANFGNRGLTVGEGDGCLYWKLGGGVDDASVTISVAGPGTLTFSGAARFTSGSFSAKGLVVAADSSVRLDRGFTFDSSSALEVLDGGTLIGPGRPFTHAKTILHSGATFTAGVADGVIGTLVLTAASVLDLDGGPLKIGVQSESFAGHYGGRLPILKVPTSVRTVTADDFTIASVKSGANTVEVETVGEVQTVYAVRPGKVYVVPEGTAGNVPTAPYDTWATAANDLATAAAAAAADATVGTVRVAPGTYYPAATVTVGSYEIRSDDGEGNLCTDRVIIDGGTTATTLGIRPFLLNNGRSCLRGLTIQNGYTSGSYESGGGGGVHVTASHASVVDCFITKCCATNSSMSGFGGGLMAPGGALAHIERTTFLWNTANQGGGAALQAYYGETSTWLEREQCCRFVDCEIISNCAWSATSYAPCGGGIFSQHWPRIHLEGSRFCGNRLEWLKESSSAAFGSQATIGDRSHCTITNCIFENAGHGYRALVNGSSSAKVRYLNCIFRNNNRSEAHLVYCGLVQNCIITNNSLGESVYSGSAHFVNCLYANNGTAFKPKNSIVENCTIVSNRAGGVFVSGSDKGVFINTISAFNKKSTAYAVGGSGSLQINYCDNLNNMTVSNCCFQGTTGAKNWNGSASADPNLRDATGASFDKDPQMRDLSADDFRLKRKSPCRDTGIRRDWMSGAIDLDGQPRCIDKRGKVTADALPDMGCYECEIPKRGAVLLVR